MVDSPFFFLLNFRGKFCNLICFCKMELSNRKKQSRHIDIIRWILVVTSGFSFSIDLYMYNHDIYSIFNSHRYQRLQNSERTFVSRVFRYLCGWDLAGLYTVNLKWEGNPLPIQWIRQALWLELFCIILHGTNCYHTICWWIHLPPCP